MKAAQECRQCLGKLVRQAATLATEAPVLRANAIEEGLKCLDREFSIDKTTIMAATQLHRRIRAVTGNADPYRRVKEEEMAIAREFCRERGVHSANGLKSCIAFAVRGNAIDFFKDLNTIRADLAGPVEFSVDNTAELEKKLGTVKSILYLGDNAGEVFFDLPLVKRLLDFCAVTYVVKQSPVQNDVTFEDLEKSGLLDELPEVITTGTDTPGVDMSMASAEFRTKFENADLVIAKGMGYWESLSELPVRGNVFYLLKTKCQPVAGSLNVALNSHIALLR